MSEQAETQEQFDAKIDAAMEKMSKTQQIGFISMIVMSMLGKSELAHEQRLDVMTAFLALNQHQTIKVTLEFVAKNYLEDKNLFPLFLATGMEENNRGLAKAVERSITLMELLRPDAEDGK